MLLLLLLVVPPFIPFFLVAIHRFRYVNKMNSSIQMKIFTFFGCQLNNFFCVLCVQYHYTANKYYNTNSYRSITEQTEYMCMLLLLKSFNLNLIFGFFKQNSKFKIVLQRFGRFDCLTVFLCLSMSSTSLYSILVQFSFKLSFIAFYYINQHVCKRHIHTTIPNRSHKNCVVAVIVKRQ